jgi:tetratricopeptide (TPR) repeat protein
LHETYAAPRYQNASTLQGIKYSHGSKKNELELARKFFQRAVTANPNFAEARLRLGHVSGLLGYHNQAVSELQAATAAVTDPQMQYYAALFLGNELAVLGRIADARKEFERAAALYPTAQSPLLALSELAHSNGDIPNASIAIERAFAVAARGRQRNDPRWKYDLVPEDKAAALLLKMRKVFGELSR